MICSAFGGKLDAILAGDASPMTKAALARHAGHCDRCRGLWEQGLALARVMTANEAGGRVVDPCFARQAREGLRDAFRRTPWPPVRFSSVQTAIGTIFVGVSDQGVFDLAFDLRGEGAYRERLARRAPEVWRDNSGLRSILGEIRAYFSGHLRDFSVPVDLRSVTPFASQVLCETQAIPFGELVSYGELAARVGSPRASRAVGGALGRNPIPVIIPCHRVVRRGGYIGGYTGGLRKKRALLRLEGHTFWA